MRARPGILLPLLIALLTPAALAGTDDPVDLRVDRNEAGEILLDWSGGAPTFELFRAAAPEGVDAPDNLLLETRAFSAVDPDPDPGPISYYFVTTISDCWRPLADARVDELTPEENFGIATELAASTLEGTQQSYLRFSMDSVPPDSIIESASLVLQQLEATGPGTVRVSASKGDWLESTLTHANQPGADDAFAEELQPEGVGPRSWDVTGLVQEWADGTRANDGLVVAMLDEVGAKYFSRETGAPEVPRLCVSFRDRALDTLAQLEEDSQSSSTVHFENATARTTDAQVPAGSSDPVDAALIYLQDYRELFRLDDPRKQLFLDRLRDWRGYTAVSFGKRRDGIPVLDETLLVRTDGTWIWGSSSGLREGRSFTGSVVLSAGDARQEAINLLAPDHDDVKTLGEPTLWWVPTEIHGEDLRLGYRVQTAATESGSGEARFNTVYLDAEDGAPLMVFEASHTGDRPNEDFETKDADNQGSDTCFLLPWEWKTTWHDDDGPRPEYPGPPEDFASDSQLTTNYTHGIFHYFQDNFAWDGMSGRGGGFASFVHWNAPGFDNARFTPICNILSYGDGWGTPDIVGHEFAHGVAFHSVPLWGTHGPGAINEHLADFFGSEMDGNWDLGEARRDGGVDLDGDGTLDMAPQLRDMADPPSFGDPDHMDGYRELDFSNDSGGVHSNNGILNKAVYMLAQGDVHRGISTAGIGRAKTRELVFDVMVSHLHPWSVFSMMGDEMVRGAQRFRRDGTAGFTTADVCDVINAYASVGLGSPDTDCDGVPNPPSGDSDGDTIPDVRDNCPTVPNVRQWDRDGDLSGDNCDPDIDGDGRLNDEDNCRLIANPNQDDADGDGVGNDCDDGDRDGILDIFDNCPTRSNYAQVDRDGDGSGDACDDDIDGDNSPNDTDNCPLDYNNFQTNSDADSHGDACDNCDLVDNEDQSDIDDDELGDACDPDIDGDGVLNDEDNCRFDANPQQLDMDFDGTGTICDDSERAFFDGLAGAQELALFLEHNDISEALRVGVFPCTAGTCPDRLTPGFNTTVTLTDLTLDYAIRVVDDRGFTVAGGLQAEAGEITINFAVDHEYFYRDAPGGIPYEGRQYFLEFFAPPGSVDGQILEGFMDVDSSLD